MVRSQTFLDITKMATLLTPRLPALTCKAQVPCPNRLQESRKPNRWTLATRPQDTLAFLRLARRKPENVRCFNNHMSAYSQGRPSWMDIDFHPVNERLISGFNADKDSVLLVDQAGGLGHDLEELCRKLPRIRWAGWSCRIRPKSLTR